MTLREFVERSDVGSRQERDRFEQRMVEASAAEAEHLDTAIVPWVLRSNLDYDWVVLIFIKAKRIGCF